MGYPIEIPWDNIFLERPMGRYILGIPLKYYFQNIAATVKSNLGVIFGSHIWESYLGVILLQRSDVWESHWDPIL